MNQQYAQNPYLLCIAGSLAGRKFYLQGMEIMIGRDGSRCHVALDLAFVSRTQALIKTDGRGRYFIYDLSNRGTTFVNDQSVTQCEFHYGDRISFGMGGILIFQFQPPETENLSSSNHSLYQPVNTFGNQFHASNKSYAETISPLPAPRATTTLRGADLPVLRIGRSPDNDIVIDIPGVSRHHASLTYQDNSQPIISDLGSMNGTFINGVPVTEPRMVNPNDLVFIGGFLLQINGRKIVKHDLSASRIMSTNITKNIAGKTILKDISLAIYPREFVGLMGPSGCGKSTLMDALNGLRPASSGTVLVNNLDLYSNFDALRRSIGYVPQKDILHDSLTVERTLYYVAKLRLPEGTSSQEIKRAVDEVIVTVGLEEQRYNPFKQLSGGQQKRLSLGIELITKPNFIFLDEPTSPLDPETTENMMLLFRRLADEGRIVVMVTHKFEKFQEMHHIAMLTKGGRLAFFGPPKEALNYFGCREPGDIYRAIGARDPDELDYTFKSSQQYQYYVASRIAETRDLNQTTGGVVGTGSQGSEKNFGIKQWLTLTRRYLEIKLKDKRNTLLLLAQAPLVAIILSLITDDVPNNPRTLFIAAIIAIWFGANNAIREIVSENAIYTRERLVNLKIPSYIFSKFAVLSGIGLIQCLLFIGILAGMKRLNPGDFLIVTLVLYLTLLAGVSIGLFFSALVNSTEKAMSILPLILIPQLLLSGFLKPLDDVYVNAKTGKPATVATYEKYERDKDKPLPKPDPRNPKAELPTPLEPVGKTQGLGGASVIAALMVARWTVEGLAHEVSITDEKARDKLAASMSVAAYQNVFDGKSEDEIKSAYRKRVLLDFTVIAFFSVLFLALTMLALKRKDVL